jgi:hypothetical protein
MASPSRFGFERLDQELCMALAEIAGVVIPPQSPRDIGLRARQMGPIEETGIVGRTQPQCGTPVAGIAAAFVKKSRRGNVASPENAVTAREQRCDL